MIEDQLILFQTAKIVKEKCFDWPTVYYYDSLGDKGSGERKINWNASKEALFSAPTQGFLQRWLREMHSINIGINFKLVSKKWDFIVYHSGLTVDEYKEHLKKYFEIFPDRNFNTYEEALEEALQEAIFYINL